jgi:hypothetical protein
VIVATPISSEIPVDQQINSDSLSPSGTLGERDGKGDRQLESCGGKA